jgi:hypothetical protein
MAVFPGLAISLAVFGFNRFGDALRDALDPKLAQTQHLNHEPQTACNILSNNELWQSGLLGDREHLLGVR